MRSHQGGNRALNAALHQIALVRITKKGPSHLEYQRLRETYPHLSAMRRLKRRLVRTVYQRLRADQQLKALDEGLADLQHRYGRWQHQISLFHLTTSRRRHYIPHHRPLDLPVDLAAKYALDALQERTSRWERVLYEDTLADADHDHDH